MIIRISIWIMALVAAALIFSPAWNNPHMTDMELWRLFWPEYVKAIIILMVASVLHIKTGRK